MPDTALAAMFSGVHSVTQTDGAIIIDRDPESFQYLLQYLENNHHWPDSGNQRQILQSELDYWGFDNIMDSKIIKDVSKLEYLNEDLPKYESLNLLFRKSRDEFTLESFDIKCSGIPNTLTFIKSVNGNVFGGYNSKKWEYGGDYDPSSLIFSIDKQTKFKPKDLKGAVIGYNGCAL